MVLLRTTHFVQGWINNNIKLKKMLHNELPAIIIITNFPKSCHITIMNGKNVRLWY